MIRTQQELFTLSCDCGASQDPFELYQLAMLAQSHGVRTVLEIGVDTGRLMAFWRDALGANVVGVDIATERFDDSTRMRDNLVVGDSGDAETYREVCRRLDGRVVDLLFIDGDHTKDATLRDFEVYVSCVNFGGLVCLHDTSRIPGEYFVPGIETRLAFDELRKSYPSVEISNGPKGDGAPGIGVLFL